MLSALILRHRPRTALAGQTLFHLDESADIAFLVVDGLILVSQFSSLGREVITSVYFPGEICAGFDVLTESIYSGTARAPSRSSATAIPLSRSELVGHLQVAPDFYGALMATQRDKERFKDRMLLGVIADTCEQRVASTLLWLDRKTAECTRPQQALFLCRQELADLVGTTVETVIRVLSSFRKRGMILEQEGHIELDSLALEGLATVSFAGP